MEAREAWLESQLDLDPERLVFIDETAAATNMARRYGRAPRGERCRIAVPHGHYKTTTVTAALRASGPCAIELMDGATNGTRFLSYVTGTLVPAHPHPANTDHTEHPCGGASYESNSYLTGYLHIWFGARRKELARARSQSRHRMGVGAARFPL